MPEMDGYELCKVIKTDPDLSGLPVILVTQLSDPEDIVRGLACGANNFIIKPYDKARLLTQVAVVLHQHTDNKRGKEVIIECNANQYPVLSEKNDILHILLSIYDTAVSKNLELEQATEHLNILTGNLEKLVEERTEALTKTTGTVEHLLMQKNDLITNIGHDLNTPLTPLVALLPYVYNHEQDQELKDILHVLVNDVSRLRGHIEQILKLSLLNQESFSMTEKNIPVKKVVDDVITGYEFSIKQLNIGVHNHIPAECTIWLSPFHATTIFENLISNAIKYNIRGGTVTFRVSDGGDFWEISVIDTGIGLTAEEAGKVFDEFYKADSSRHDQHSHGLGLTIVQRIVSMCGGSVRLSSQGKMMGSIFQVQLPKYKKGRTNTMLSVHHHDYNKPEM